MQQVARTALRQRTRPCQPQRYVGQRALAGTKGKEPRKRPLPTQVAPIASSSKVTIDDPPNPSVSLALSPQQHTHSDTRHRQGPPNPPTATDDYPSTSLPFPMPRPSVPMPQIRHPFNTHQFVNQLEQSGFSRDAAEAIMRATKSLLEHEESRAALALVGKGDLENEAYLFKAALGELQTEVMVQARNNSIALRSANGLLQREIDNMQQMVREDVAELKNEIQLEFNNRKEDSSVEQKNLELKIIDLSNKFTVSLGDLRTDLEANKWVQTRRSLMIISLALIFVISLYSWEGATEPPPPRPPSAADLGLTQATESESSPLYPLRRVGEEDE